MCQYKTTHYLHCDHSTSELTLRCSEPEPCPYIDYDSLIHVKREAPCFECFMRELDPDYDFELTKEELSKFEPAQSHPGSVGEGGQERSQIDCEEVGRRLMAWKEDREKWEEAERSVDAMLAGNSGGGGDGSEGGDGRKEVDGSQGINGNNGNNGKKATSKTAVEGETITMQPTRISPPTTLQPMNVEDPELEKGGGGGWWKSFCHCGFLYRPFPPRCVKVAHGFCEFCYCSMLCSCGEL